VTLTNVYDSAYPTSINLVLLAVRLFLGLMIFSHGYAKVFRGGKLAGTAGWFNRIGMKPGKINAFMAASTELGVGILLSLGFLTPLASAGLISVMTVAIVTVHRKNGWFIFNKGEGIEYCLSVIFMALVPGTFGAGKFSIDHVWRILRWSNTTSLVVTVVVGVGGALLQLAACYRPPKQG
jgi:putative oxidoreductase